MRGLQGLGDDGQVAGAEVLPLERELFLRPRLGDEVERFLEALAAFVLRDAVAVVVHRRGAAAGPELEATVAEEVGDGGLFGNLHGIVQGQQRDRRAQADPRRALRRRRQHHERIGENRERAAEVELAEPHRVEAQHVPELDLRHQVLVPLILGIRTGTR